MMRWLFENRGTGRITVGQFPNRSLGLYLLATVVRVLAGSRTGTGEVAGAVATGALMWWAADELVRGVNPWRRMLGAGVLVGQVLRLAG